MKFLRLLPFVVLIGAWVLVTTILDLFPAILLPSPESVARYALEATADGVLGSAIWGSVGRFLVGLVVGGLLAVPLALLAASNPAASSMLLPFAKFFQAISGVTWIPLAVLWFGISSGAAVFIIVNPTFFIVFYATLTGVRSIDHRLPQSVRTLGGGYGTILWNVLLPGSLPHVLNGLRVAVGYGWRALIAAEIIASGAGLGVLIWEGQQELNTRKIFVGLLLIGIISLAMDRLVLRPFERRTIQRWGLSTART
jgi:NitT/TauT family transport system permease protein/taurine transport system permease protein